MELNALTKFQNILGVHYKTDGSDPVKHKSIYYWFLTWTLFGAEYGYLIVLPFFWWNVDVHVMRHTIVVMVFSMYVGQWIKSYTPWPRPTSPPVARLEHIYVAESTMPSTHAVMGTALPFSILFFISQLYDINFILGIFIASFCAINICLSRIFLGMHYFSDVVIGCGISCLMLSVLQQYILTLDAFVLHHPYLTILGAIILAIIFPAPNQNENGLREDTCKLLGVLLGAYMAQVVFYNLHLLQIPCLSVGSYIQVSRNSFSLWNMFICALRFAIGLPIALLVRTVSRFVISRVLMGIINSFPNSFTPPTGISVKRWGPFEIPFYLLSYFLIASSIQTVTTYLYIRIGLTSSGYQADYPLIMTFSKDNPLNFTCVTNK